MNKKGLVDAVASRCCFPKAQVEKVVDSLTEVIGETLKNGDTVAIANFGTFKTKDVAARSGKMKGKEWSTPATKSASFKPFDNLNKTVRG